jgi:hypothetical protein
MFVSPTFIRHLAAWGLFSILVVAAGCAQKTALSQDAQKTRQVVGVVTALKGAMEKRDVDAVLALFSPDYPVRDVVRARIAEDFSGSSEVRFDASIDRIVFEKGRVSVAVFWQGTWKRALPNGEIRRHGDAVLILSDAPHYLIVQGMGSLPWGIPSSP